MPERATHQVTGEVIEVEGSAREEILLRGGKLDGWDIEREPDQPGPFNRLVTQFDPGAGPAENVEVAMVKLRMGLPGSLTDQQRHVIEQCTRPVMLALATLYAPRRRPPGENR